MVPLRFKSLALCLALLPCLLGPGPQEPKRGDGRRGTPQTEEERLHKEVLGFWELTHMSGNGNSYYGADLKGYLLFATDHLAFEYHYQEPTRERTRTAVSFQSGIQKYRFDGLGRMETLSLIGAGGSDAEAGLFLEQPGRPRVFTIELMGDRLVLAHTFSRFEYDRVETTPYSDLEPGVNFDDRLPPKEDEEK